MIKAMLILSVCVLISSAQDWLMEVKLGVGNAESPGLSKWALNTSVFKNRNNSKVRILSF